MRIPVSKAGWPYIVLAVVAAFAVACLSVLLSIPLWLLALIIMNFFRDPERESLEPGTVLLSPADGKIIQVETSDTPDRYADHIKISVFMTIFDVHVNRSPVAGKITSIDHFPGSFLNASHAASSLQNERVEIAMETAIGPVMVRLVAGLIARRIVPMIYPDSRVKRGERIGLIKFGSRVDTYVPKNLSIDVSPGTRVRAGVTRIASTRPVQVDIHD
ncbi:phosphatidylserine decarboxylase [bacterium]|nr:phosphatidylserine decarboxylase [candidate division CSSED10-310 bacterium]